MSARRFALLAFALVGCAHGPSIEALQRRVDALEARAVELPAAPSPSWEINDGSRGIYLASFRPKVEKSLLAQGVAPNCVGGGACVVTSVTATGTSTADHFVATGNGSSSAPAFGWANMGFSRLDVNNLSLSFGGAAKFNFTVNGLLTGNGNGGLQVNSATTVLQYLGSTVTTDGSNVTVTNAGNGSAAFVVKAAPGQTANLQEWNVNGGAAVASVSAAGAVTAASASLTTALPIASGGTNSTATATAGGIGYGTGTAHAYTAAATSGQFAVSGGAGAPTFVSPDHTICVYNAGNLAAGGAFGEFTLTRAATVDTSSKVAQDVVGVGAGNWVVKVCTDGVTCAGGNTYLTYTEACTAAVGTRTAATVQNSGAIAAASTVTVSVTTACATTDPGANVCIHYTTP